MQAVVLVGGFGTRLRPLTQTVPKPMLPVGHRPIIERLIDSLIDGGVDEVVLALGFQPEPFRAAFPNGTYRGVPLRYAVEPEPLDTAGAIRFAADFAGITEQFVVANGDILTDLDIGALAAHHRHLGAEATIHVIGVDDPSAFGVVDVDSTGHVHRFVEKPAPGTAPSNLINAGTYVLEPSVLERIPLGQKVSIERVVFPQIATDRRLVAYATDDYWIDTGRPELYLAANLDLIDGRRGEQRCVAVDAAAIVDPSATIRHSLVGAGATIGARAEVIDSVVLPGATIGAGARLQRSIVVGRIGADAEVRDSVIGSEGVVAAGDVVDAEKRPAP